MCLFGFHSNSNLLTSIHGINTPIVPYSSTVKLPHTKSEIVCVMQSIKGCSLENGMKMNVHTDAPLLSFLPPLLSGLFFTEWMDIGRLKAFIWSERDITVRYFCSVNGFLALQLVGSGFWKCALLLTAGLVPRQMHPRLFTGPLLAHRNWQLYSDICKAGSQAQEFVLDLSWGTTAWLICNHAEALILSYMVKCFPIPHKPSVSLSDKVVKLLQD